MTLYLSSPLPPDKIYDNQTDILRWLKSLGHAVEFARDYSVGPRPAPIPKLRRPPQKPDPSLPNSTSELVEYVGTACPYCGTTMMRKGRYMATRDHKYPKSRGGTLASHNKIVVCSKCNNDKGDRSLEEWADALRLSGDGRAEKVGWIVLRDTKGRAPAVEAPSCTT